MLYKGITEESTEKKINLILVQIPKKSRGPLCCVISVQRKCSVLVSVRVPLAWNLQTSIKSL